MGSSKTTTAKELLQLLREVSAICPGNDVMNIKTLSFSKMDVATQFSQVPASKIIYITPKRNVLQQNLENTQEHVNIVETVHSLVNRDESGTCGTKGPSITIGLNERLQKNDTENGNQTNVVGMAPKTLCEFRPTCVTERIGNMPTKPVAATQTVLVSQTGSTILDEMKKRAGEAFRKLNMYQSNNASQELEKKSVLLPGTDSEYRTPGAHYRNKNGQIKRPMNAFMVWAREFRGKLAAAMPNATNSDISIKLGQVWSNLPPEQKRQYYNIAEKIKLKHRQDFPDWVYKPVPTIKKKDYIPTENCVPVREMVTSSSHRNIVPSFPLVNLVPDINNNQSSTTTATRIPVIIQPVTYHPGTPADDRTVKEKLADKIGGGIQNVPNVLNVPRFSAQPLPVENVGTLVRMTEPSIGQLEIATRPGEVIRPVSGQLKQTKLGQLLTNPNTEMLNKVPISTAEPVTSFVQQMHANARKLPTEMVSIVKDKTPDFKQPLANQEALDRSQGHTNAMAYLDKSKSNQIDEQKKEPTRVNSRVEDITSDNSSMPQRKYVTGDRFIQSHNVTDCKSHTDHKPMYLELLDPFDPLMDCDFLYSELYPGCLHLDVTRWREYLDISTDDENDPLSRFQDDSDDDIKISPVPLKESLKRMCNANVQKSASGDVITCDIMVPVSNSCDKDGYLKEKQNISTDLSYDENDAVKSEIHL